MGKYRLRSITCVSQFSPPHLLHGGILAVGGQVLCLVLLPQEVDVDEDGPLLDVHHGGVVHEVEPVGVVLADVVHRHEHRPLTLARQLDVTLEIRGLSVRPNCLIFQNFKVMTYDLHEGQ